MKPIRRTRVDSNQPDIVAAIEKAGWLVWVIGWPCDLLCWKQGRGFKTIEVKPPRKNNLPRLRKEQIEQASFCATTGTPYITTAESAIKYLEE